MLFVVFRKKSLLASRVRHSCTWAILPKYWLAKAAKRAVSLVMAWAGFSCIIACCVVSFVLFFFSFLQWEGWGLSFVPPNFSFSEAQAVRA